MDIGTANRRIDAYCQYFQKIDESPRAATDLRDAIETIRREAYIRGKTECRKTRSKLMA